MSSLHTPITNGRTPNFDREMFHGDTMHFHLTLWSSSVARDKLHDSRTLPFIKRGTKGTDKVEDQRSSNRFSMTKGNMVGMHMQIEKTCVVCH